jgi:GNAT superfamily N-acetyltransferase
VAALRLVHEQDHYPHRWPADPYDWLQPPRQRNAWVAVTVVPPEPAGQDEPEGRIAGHVALNTAEGDPSIGISSEACGLTTDRLAVVSRLFVSVGCRRRGLARALLGHAVGHAHSQGLRPVLDVLEADRAAIALYEADGWQRVGSVTFRSRLGEPLPGSVYVGPPPPAMTER